VVSQSTLVLRYREVRRGDQVWLLVVLDEGYVVHERENVLCCEDLAQGVLVALRRRVVDSEGFEISGKESLAVALVRGEDELEVRVSEDLKLAFED
jgi:hypothetical protein